MSKAQFTIAPAMEVEKFSIRLQLSVGGFLLIALTHLSLNLVKVDIGLDRTYMVINR